VTVLRTGTQLSIAKVAVWLQADDGKRSLVVFDGFDGSLVVDYNAVDRVSEGGWLEAERVPGGRIRIEGRYEQMHTVRELGEDGREMPPPALDRRAGREAISNWACDKCGRPAENRERFEPCGKDGCDGSIQPNL
jgi:hypothetical protein